jgi:RNA polymerase sigma-70 factor (ECF subfamily)
VAQQPGNWTAWLDEHGAALVLFARQWTHCQAEAEDVVQDAFVRFWRKGSGARGGPAYLYACVRSVAMDHRRSAARRRRREQFSYAPAASESLFEDAPARHERRAAVETALATLPAEQREVIVMKIWGELTFRDIGEVLSIPMNTAASRHRYGMNTLRRLLSEERLR